MADDAQTSTATKDGSDSAHLEQVLSEAAIDKQTVDYSRVDNEIQQYAGQQSISIDEATNKRLRKMIDRRVLAVMILTYFLQALDKGTMSFASIMGIREYAGLENGQKVPTSYHSQYPMY